ncbi:RNA polymerase subunit sigma-24 [Nocardioides sp. NBC_00850]|uniref:RNA polymerase sigma factor n=1 Tax=Nocardioides sp. NBC_00850 TaxID=2976001 RepID=UPI00386B238E|nr:RNA polymerase subunit sigma-24 [Nocardioides sp. NBC_00850]
MLETLLRDEWGRLLALLVAQFRRLDLAEDGLADAFEAAARRWPVDGEPDNGPAWLLTTARRRIVDRMRSEEVLARKMPLLAVDAAVTQEAQRVMVDSGEVTDERLRLVLLCAHPTLSREAAAALTLRLVLGVSTEDIGRLFLQSKATMAARLTRARKRLAGASFEVPADLAGRVGIVAEVAYLAFTAGYAPGTGPDVVRSDLAGEAIRLVRVLRSVLPEPDPEIDALLALMLLQHSRRAARIGPDGALVLLPDQDRTHWRTDEIAEALALLTPLAHAAPAPYLLQALIAAEHALAPSSETTAWKRIVERYDELLALQDTPVVRLNRAVAVAEANGAEAGLEALDSVALPGHRLPAVRAQLLERSGRHDDAIEAYAEAIALCTHEPERADLTRRQRALEGFPPQSLDENTF